MACVCGGGAEGPWRDGDVLYVTFTREARAVVVIGPDGTRRPWGAHHLPALFRDLEAGAAHIVWRNEEWCDNVGRQWDSANVSRQPPRAIA